MTELPDGDWTMLEGEWDGFSAIWVRTNTGSTRRVVTWAEVLQIQGEIDRRLHAEIEDELWDEAGDG